MKLVALLTVAAAVVASVPVQEMPAPPTALDQHRWLEQLVGEWTVTSELTVAPGAEPMRMESSESVRSLGGLWILAESTASFGGTPFTSILTLGYDPEKKAFVGTWIDTMQTQLWTYRGTLDETKKILTLETEGPDHEDPTKTAQYRDALEIKGPDHKVLTSSIEQADGTWSTFVRADYRRKQ
jgi:hypothetical protein